MLNAKPVDVTPIGGSRTPSSEPPEKGLPVFGAAWEYGGAVSQFVGKIYSHNEGTDSDQVCSGTVVQSRNNATVITAGHCVYLDQAWQSNWIVVPGQRVNESSGEIEEPFGRWAAQSILSTH